MKIPEAKKLPSGNYNITLRLGGQNYSITKATARECEITANLIKSEYRAGKRLKRVNITLGDAIDKFIKSRRSVLSASTINGYECIRKTRFQEYMDKSVSDIKDWQEVINTEAEKDISAKTLKNSWALVCSALKYAGADVPEVKLPQIQQAVRPWLDADQVKTFVKAVKGHPCEIPALLALHSLRRSEILGLTWDKIDLDKKQIKVEGSAVIGSGNKLIYKETNKTKRSRRIVPIMIPELEAALEAVPEVDRKGFVYTRNPTLIWEQVNYICDKNKLPKVGVHGLRHSFCSVALSSDVGLTEREVMEIGGWEDFQTVHKIYEHLSDKNRKQAAEKFSAFFKNADGNADDTSKA